MSRDHYDRREDERGWQRADDLRREQRRADMLAEQRRIDSRREDERRAERRREDQRQDAIEAEERRRRREDEEKAQDENRRRAMGLLRTGFTDWGAAALGLDPARTRGAPTSAPTSTPAQPEPPRPRFDWSWPASDPAPAPERLAAPFLLRSEEPDGRTRLSWLPVPGAAGYAVEESIGPSFAFASEIFRGERTELVRGIPFPFGTPRARPGPKLYVYRVKALGPAGAPDSAWSNTA